MQMTYVCSKNGKFDTYDIDDNCDLNDLNEYFDIFFNVDTLMASPVALLNQKGYITEMSCSGHFIKSICCDSYVQQSKPLNTLVEKSENDLIRCYSVENILDNKSFIRFRHNYNFSILPQKWKLVDNTYLYFEYEKDLTEFEFYIAQVQAIKNLYDWVETLKSIL